MARRPAASEQAGWQVWVGSASSRPVKAVVRPPQRPRRRTAGRSLSQSGHRTSRSAQDSLRPKQPLKRRARTAAPSLVRTNVSSRSPGTDFVSALLKVARLLLTSRS